MGQKITIEGIEVELGSDNPYADLGLPDVGEMLVKAKLSEMSRGKFRGISQAKMIACLNCLGRDVEIVVKKASRNAVGDTQVVVA
ncbi:MAG: XRE family transcriptional regulator [Collimonas sp.]|uniref:helix-turn-helix domain-containing protein n=1 Tax=Collimonas sp. TaxID=1963772 RepID=UPI0032670D84